MKKHPPLSAEEKEALKCPPPRSKEDFWQEFHQRRGDQAEIPARDHQPTRVFPVWGFGLAAAALLCILAAGIWQMIPGPMPEWTLEGESAQEATTPRSTTGNFGPPDRGPASFSPPRPPRRTQIDSLSIEVPYDALLIFEDPVDHAMVIWIDFPNS
ncbi:MAG: hypothetical protein JJU29_15210 [Verrucomicrobia bacterium]|nr:hypothetical protein [Verrucomicrobiota bacterium]MCH8513186.1 hypothetical protein [Kiritimatiellia bacterium]